MTVAVVASPVRLRADSVTSNDGTLSTRNRSDKPSFRDVAPTIVTATSTSPSKQYVKEARRVIEGAFIFVCFLVNL